MKTKLILSLIVVFMAGNFVSGQSKRTKDLMAYTSKNETNPELITWNKKVYDFGKIEHKKPVTAVFELKNTSNKPVLITNVKTSCGCTNVSYPKKAIVPGKIAKISAVYNSKSKGVFSNQIYVSTNLSKKRIALMIKGKVG